MDEICNGLPPTLPDTDEPQELAKKIDASYTKTLEHLGNAVLAAIECGRYLNEAKDIEAERRRNYISE